MKKFIICSVFFLALYATQAQDTTKPAPNLVAKIDSIQKEAQKYHDVMVALAVTIGHPEDTVAHSPMQVAQDAHDFFATWKVSTAGERAGLIFSFLIMIFFSLTQYHIPGFSAFVINAIAKVFSKKTAMILMLFGMFGFLNAQKVNTPESQLKLMKVAPVGATMPTSGNILFAAPNFGLTPLTIEKPFSGGNWEADGTITPSFSYGFMVGEYTTNADSSLDIQPYIGVSAYIAGGIIPSNVLRGSFQTGVSVDIYKYADVSWGYDWATKKQYIGLGAYFSLPTFKKGLGSKIIKLF